MSPRTKMAEELSVLAEELATKLETHDDAETRAFAARTLRMLGKNVALLSACADQLEANYDQAMKLATDAAKVADRSLKDAETMADALRGLDTSNVKN